MNSTLCPRDHRWLGVFSCAHEHYFRHRRYRPGRPIAVDRLSRSFASSLCHRGNHVLRRIDQNDGTHLLRSGQGNRRIALIESVVPRPIRSRCGHWIHSPHRTHVGGTACPMMRGAFGRPARRPEGGLHLSPPADPRGSASAASCNAGRRGRWLRAQTPIRVCTTTRNE